MGVPMTLSQKPENWSVREHLQSDETELRKPWLVQFWLAAGIVKFIKQFIVGSVGEHE
jgi:hypothetical protein